ncbi:MAG: S9 family peptidase [Candidatus Eisenbacteria bacterium]|uniref:Acyl-peptide hydrolase n=1 Tax=Eiseniibacteriota bacterium TaxID=2212470 RepID=A0A9D6QK33_UNCEI|nr:S9 family peptidase [Candidatus Eisenbacteria bacterium]
MRSAGPKQPGQLFVLPMTGGEAQRVCELAKGVSQPSWSPDGARIAFASATNMALDDPRREKPKHEPARVVTRPVFRENEKGWIEVDHLDQVWVVDAAPGSTPRALTTGPFAVEAPRWSRDGTRILFASDRRAEPWFGPWASAIYAVSAALGKPTDGAALETVVELGGLIASFVEHPDGRIAVVGFISTDPPRTYQIPRMLMTEGPWPRRIAQDLSTGCDDEIGGAINSDQHPPRGGGESPLAFSTEGRTVDVVVARQGSSLLARFDAAAGGVRDAMPAGFDLIAGTASDDARVWALTVGTPQSPGDLYRLDAATGALTRLWSPNEAMLADLAFGEVEELWAPTFDGRKIHGWLVKPPDFDPAKRYPLLLEIHGGPHTAYGRGFFHEFHALAGAGYLVLYTNPRGSTSYGESFADVIQYAFPGDDARDLLAAVDAVVARGCVDTARLGVTGGSGGGLLTNWIITQTDRFAAAVTQRCVAEWESFYYSTDFSMFAPFWFRKPPFEDPGEYRERSPVALASRITTPLMVIHSEEDWRTPIAQGEAMFRALKQQRKAAVMVRFPGENHELSRSGVPSRRVQNQRHIRAWFDRWLLGTPAPEYGV